jgi:hypothetical protein
VLVLAFDSQAGHEIIAPLYPKTNLAIPIVEEYRKTLKPSDILDDPPTRAV